MVTCCCCCFAAHWLVLGGPLCWETNHFISFIFPSYGSFSCVMMHIIRKITYMRELKARTNHMWSINLMTEISINISAKCRSPKGWIRVYFLILHEQVAILLLWYINCRIWSLAHRLLKKCLKPITRIGSLWRQPANLGASAFKTHDEIDSFWRQPVNLGASAFQTCYQIDSFWRQPANLGTSAFKTCNQIDSFWRQPANLGASAFKTHNQIDSFWRQPANFGATGI